jgi:hypothetical protein
MRIAKITGSTVNYYHADMERSARLVTSSTGSVLFADSIPGKRKRRKGRVGFFSLAAIMLVLILVNSWFPEALFLALGAVGFSAGVGLRVSYYLLFQSKWGYCPKCEKQSWIIKRDGKWYCNKKGHVVELSAITTTGLRRASPEGQISTDLSEEKPELDSIGTGNGGRLNFPSGADPKAWLSMRTLR